jgi:hypothetical protein
MKIAAMATLAIIAGTMAWAEGVVPPAERKVIVCMEGGATQGVDLRAQALASKIFAGIGVALQWGRGLRGCPAQAILISLRYMTPSTLEPAALAYALPYEGAHIVVFYDRIAHNQVQGDPSILLGHVVAHEITHILQGTARHSDRGIMKARWNRHDFDDMKWKPLPFADQDIQRIYFGIEARAARAARPGLAVSEISKTIAVQSMP